MQGIYGIRNIINNNMYIGQSINIESRWLSHKEDLRNNKHCNDHLQRAWNKYGEKSFEFSIIEECNDLSLLDIKEQYWIDFYGGLNSTKVYNQRDAGSHGTHSVYTRQKISESQKGTKKPGRVVSEEGRKSLSISHIGIKPSEETRRKMSISQTGRKHTEESKMKISNAHKKRFQENPELAKAISERMKNRVVSKETREKIGKASLGRTYKDNKELCQKHSQSLKDAYKTGRKKAVWITVNGISKMQHEWADLLDINSTSIIYQRKKGEGFAEKYIEQMLKKKNIII